MLATLEDLRIKLDQQTEKIVSGLKDRSRYLLNKGVFDSEFCWGMSWFKYRLTREQLLDNEFGRFDFPDQQPIYTSKELLCPPLIRRVVPQNGIENFEIDISEKLIEIYRETLPAICCNGESPETCGETAKCDVSNILLCHERANGLGRQVAAWKINDNPNILYLNTDLERENALRNREREGEVIKTAEEIAKKYQMSSISHIATFFEKLISLTIYVEKEYVKKVRENQSIRIL